MPHQQLIADVGGEINPETGLMAYRTIVASMPRQMGKTQFVLSAEGERCSVWEEPQVVIYTAQTGTDARDKLLEDQVPILETNFRKYLRKNNPIYRAKGEEAVYFANGSRIKLSASSAQSGHGKTVDLGVLDEVWADEDHRREQSIVPMMKTRPNAQLLIVSTMGTDKSIYLNRLVEKGRAAAAADKGSGIAYFEWSIPPDADYENPEVWWENMPALGWTVTPEVIAHDLETMELSEWLRADGNIPTKAEHDRIIPSALWLEVCRPQATVNRELKKTVFAIDVLPDRSSAAIAASDGDSVELIDQRAGTGWVVERVKSLLESWGGRAVVDGGGPAASVADDLEAEQVAVERMTTAEVAAACACMYDAIADHKVKVRTDERMNVAVEGLAKRPIADRFIWSRSASLSDITPFFAATLALERAVHQGNSGILMYISGEEAINA